MLHCGHKYDERDSLQTTQTRRRSLAKPVAASGFASVKVTDTRLLRFGMVKRLAMEELSGIASSIELLETLIINAKQGTPREKANGLRERVVDNRGAKQGVGYGGPRRGKRYNMKKSAKRVRTG